MDKIRKTVYSKEYAVEEYICVCPKINESNIYVPQKESTQ